MSSFSGEQQRRLHDEFDNLHVADVLEAVIVQPEISDEATNSDQLSAPARNREGLRRAWQAERTAARTARASGDTTVEWHPSNAPMF